MKINLRALTSFLAVSILSVGLAAQTTSARYDSDIQSRVTQQLAKKHEFRNLQATTEDGIVSLSGNVDLYQQKLDAAKKVRKLDKVQGVRNLVAVEFVRARRRTRSQARAQVALRPYRLRQPVQLC